MRHISDKLATADRDEDDNDEDEEDDNMRMRMRMRMRINILRNECLCLGPQNKIKRYYVKGTLCILRTFHQHPNCCFCFCLISSERVYKKGQYLMRIAIFCVKCIKILKYKSPNSKLFRTSQRITTFCVKFNNKDLKV